MALFQKAKEAVQQKYVEYKRDSADQALNDKLVREAERNAYQQERLTQARIVGEKRARIQAETRIKGYQSGQGQSMFGGVVTALTTGAPSRSGFNKVFYGEKPKVKVIYRGKKGKKGKHRFTQRAQQRYGPPRPPSPPSFSGVPNFGL